MFMGDTLIDWLSPFRNVKESNYPYTNRYFNDENIEETKELI